ncbi:hypothetical protein [Flagellimonas marinaquae]
MKIKQGYLHIVIVLLIGLILPLLSGLLKLVIVPYLAYLLFKSRFEHFPALVILMGYGSILTIAGCLLIIPMVVQRLWSIENRFIRRFLKLLLFMLPVYVIITVIRIGSGTELVDALSMNDYYLAFWFLLYGVVIHQQFNHQNLGYLIIFGLLLFLILRIGLGGINPFGALLRQVNYFIMFSLLLVADHLLYLRTKHSWVFYLLFITSFFLFIPSVNFTFYFGLILALFALRNWQSRGNTFTTSGYFKEKIYPKLLQLFPVLFLVTTIWLTPFFASDFVEVNVENKNSTLLEKVLFKLFWDRGQIWSGALDGILSNTGLLPPIREWKLTYAALGNNGLENNYEVEFESHNLMLGLIRYNGYLFGGVLIYLFLKAMRQLYNAKAYLLGRQRALAIAVIGLGIAVFITGQYILQLNTSFLFMSVIGGLIACSDSLPTDKL